MSKKILFSPIGGNDPVSSKTERDGSMLHICRMYRPDEVYLYLSKEMVERHNKDDRYVYCINKLGELLNHSFNVTVIENFELEDVQDYDLYYQEFKKHISLIEQSLENDDILYVNIASGTPQMKSALLMMAVMSEKNMKAIQVVTPEARIQEHAGLDGDYDPEYYWEINKDNDENIINRCIEPNCPNLVVVLKKNIISRHLRAYNYSAARLLAEEIKENLTDEAFALIEMAEARSQFDLNRASKISLKHGYDLFPIKSSNHKNTFEYILNLKLKKDRGEIADFIRALSPLLTDLFETVLKTKCSINIDNYCKETLRGKKWSVNLLDKSQAGREILQVLNDEFNNCFKDTYVMASNLKPLLLNYLKDANLINTVTEIRDVEEKIRNTAAHHMESITENSIGKLLGNNITVDRIFKDIQTLAVASEMKINKETLSSYDNMNEYIVEKICE